MTPVVPTIRDDTLAPPGKHVVNLFGGHAPYELKGGGWDQGARPVRRRVLDIIETFAPGWRNEIIDMQVLLAPDLERIVGLPQGHIFHGELAPDQVFFSRPAAHYADYRTPIRGLYVCGSSMHPGGGVSGIPGHNAAREISEGPRQAAELSTRRLTALPELKSAATRWPRRWMANSSRLRHRRGRRRVLSPASRRGSK